MTAQTTVDMPQAPDIEKAVLSALAAGAGSFSELTSACFYVPAHRKVFEVLGSIAETSGGCVNDYVAACYAAADALSEDYGESKIKALDILSACYHIEVWDVYVDVLRNLAARRNLIKTAAKLIGWASDDSPVDDNAIRALYAIAEDTQRAIALAAAA